MRRLLVLSLSTSWTIMVALSACDGGGSQPPASYCATSADCPSTMVCEFSVTAGCDGAEGQCASASTTAIPCGPQQVCTCAGATTAVCIVGGYTASGPVQSLGACEAGSSGQSTDASAADATAD